MFGLLKPAWQSESADKRLQAIKKMDALDAANQDILLNLANSDPESEVRHCAIDQLTDPSALHQISKTHADKATRAQAHSTLRQRIGAKSILSEEAFRQLVVTDAELKPVIAMCCPHAAIRKEIVQSLSDSEQVGIIADIEYTDTRQFIARKLMDIETLEQARKLLKGKDKSAEKIIRAKLNEHHTMQRQQQEQFATARLLCEKMEYIASHASQPDFQAMFNLWSQRWEVLDFTPNTEFEERYLAAHSQAKHAIIRQEKQRAVNKAQQGLVNELQKYCAKIATLSLHELSNERDNIHETLSRCKTFWDELIATSPSKPSTLEDQFNNAQKALLSLNELCEVEFSEKVGTVEDDPNALSTALRKAIRAISWPNEQTELRARKEAIASLEEFDKTAKKNTQESAHKLDKLHKRINRLLGSTKRGNIGQAKRELAAITKASLHYSGRDKTVLDERLQKASDAVGKIGDWKDFATEPKFMELCESMEALTTSDLHPDALAGKISKLQNSWKSLGYSECADQYWERFKTAADKAYEPCAAFFAKRHETRQSNLEKREPLVTQMQELQVTTQWDDATDYKKIESELKQIAQAWQKIKDVERSAGQEQWDRLLVFRSAIYAKLDVVYDENIESKHQLIKQTGALLEADVKTETLNKLKLFQNRWKQIGVTRRKQDQAAWKDFKAASDAVYEKIQAANKSKRAEEDVHLSGYREITQQIRQLGKSQTSLNEADKTFEQLRNDYQALPPLPKGLAEKLAERLDNDFKQACDRYNTARADLKEGEYQQAIEALSKKSQLCAELENSTAADEAERLLAALDAIEIADNELKRRFATRLQCAQQTDRSEANEARQRLCLDLEILLDVESPAEDQALRMQVQLERMKGGGLGQVVRDLKTSLQEFKLDWLCLPGADPELQNSLEQRFQKALKNTTLI